MLFDFKVSHVSRELETPFVISRGAKTHADCVVVEVKFEGHVGRGECVPYQRYGETVESAIEQLSVLKDPAYFTNLKSRLEPCAARNAVDCAFWDLRSKIAGRPVWELASLPAVDKCRVTQTLSLDTPENMSKATDKLTDEPLIKIKLGGDQDVECVRAVRATRPNANIIVDANEGWTKEKYIEIIPSLVEAGVEMIEQPFPEGNDGILAELDRPIAICADESVHTSKDVEKLKDLYDMVNIKLDKTGGLTEALLLRRAARNAGMTYMIGCMVGSSLSMAPAALLAQGAAYVDLDGPLFLKEDVQDSIVFKEGLMYPFSQQLWG